MNSNTYKIVFSCFAFKKKNGEKDWILEKEIFRVFFVLIWDALLKRESTMLIFNRIKVNSTDLAEAAFPHKYWHKQPRSL